MDEASLRILVKQLRDLADNIAEKGTSRIIRANIEYDPYGEVELCIRYYPIDGSDRTAT